MLKLYNELCTRMICSMNRLNGGGAVLIVLLVVGVLAYFTVTSKNFHGIHVHK